MNHAAVQGDQLNMALFYGTLKKVTCPVLTYTVAYAAQVTLYKVPEKQGHVKKGHPVYLKLDYIYVE